MGPHLFGTLGSTQHHLPCHVLHSCKGLAPASVHTQQADHAPCCDTCRYCAYCREGALPAAGQPQKPWQKVNGVGRVQEARRCHGKAVKRSESSDEKGVTRSK